MTPWADLSLGGDPRLIVGRRKQSGLIDCYRIEIHEDTFVDFRDIAQATIGRLEGSTRRDYAHFGALDEDEYFAIDTASIPRRMAGRRRTRHVGDEPTVPTGIPRALATEDSAPGVGELAAALRMIADADSHPVLSANDLRNDLKLTLYAICFPIDSGFVGFIRRSGPQRSISPGYRYFQYGDTLKRVEHPDFVFDDRIDIVIGSEELAILSVSAVQVLFADVRLVTESVAENVSRVVNVFKEHLPFSDGSKQLLDDICSKGPRTAKRLDDLVRFRLSEISLDPTALMEVLTMHKLSDLIRDGRIVLDESSIPDFFDFLEGRLFHDDHTQEARRADRFSSRG